MREREGERERERDRETHPCERDTEGLPPTHASTTTLYSVPPTEPSGQGQTTDSPGTQEGKCTLFPIKGISKF